MRSAECPQPALRAVLGHQAAWRMCGKWGKSLTPFYQLFHRWWCLKEAGALFWWVVQTLVQRWQQHSCPCVPSQPSPTNHIDEFAWITDLKLGPCLYMADLACREFMTIVLVEDPTFWDGAVSGVQDDVMPILKVMSSVPTSLTFSQSCQFGLFFPCVACPDVEMGFHNLRATRWSV